MNHPIPIVFVVGFLGAGKTTFLREILPLLEEKELEPFVIINDYSNAKVDATLLQEEGRAVTPINGSCICCDSLFELMNVLLEVRPTDKRVVLVEANGTTDPPVLVEHLLVNPQLRRRFSPIIQVAVVDLERWQRREKYNDLEHRQVETASHILFTRQETASIERYAEVREDIEWFNPKSRWTKLQGLASEIDELVKHNYYAQSDSTGEVETMAREDVPGCHRLSHTFVGIEIDLPDPMPVEQLSNWLNSLPGDVLRVKGVVRLAEKPERWFQFQRLDEHDGKIKLRELPKAPSVPACAVLIGVGLDEAAIRELLNRFEAIT